MKWFDEARQIIYVHTLIKRGGTGTVAQLARKLGESKRNTYRKIDALKDLGFPVKYSRTRQSYYYSGEVSFNIEMTIDGIKIF
jgi:predicted DNA-binding transcriptional regulator YafY